MRRILLKILTAGFLLTMLYACTGRSGPSEKAADGQVADSVLLISPEDAFRAQPIPKEVLNRMRGNSLPLSYEADILRTENLRYLRLLHIDFEGHARQGELICHRSIADDLLDIFRQLYEAGYPIRSIRLTDDFEGLDEASMEADNTSCFNYRTIAGGVQLSKHAQGLAVDINPLENPCVRHGRVEPASATAFAVRDSVFEHKIDHQDLCYRLFIAKGFHWGGDWRSLKDYQHFEK